MGVDLQEPDNHLLMQILRQELAATVENPAPAATNPSK